MAAWAREGLVDGISAGAFLNTQWHVAAAAFRERVGGAVAVYACTDYCADRRPGLPVRAMPVEPALLRGFAAGSRAAGADGVELFNFFCAREESWERERKEPSFATLREMRAPEALRGGAKTYTVTCGWANAETDGPIQVPVAIEKAQVRAFHLQMAAEPEGARVEADVYFGGNAEARADRLWLQVNALSAGPAVRLEDAPAKDVRKAVFTVPAAALRDGRNELMLRNEAAALTVLSLDVRTTG